QAGEGGDRGDPALIHVASLSRRRKAQDQAGGEADQQIFIADLDPLLARCGAPQPVAVIVAHRAVTFPVAEALALLPAMTPCLLHMLLARLDGVRLMLARKVVPWLRLRNRHGEKRKRGGGCNNSSEHGGLLVSMTGGNCQFTCEPKLNAGLHLCNPVCNPAIRGDIMIAMLACAGSCRESVPRFAGLVLRL